ncbi:Uncharacterized protein TCM_038536 [Theobroma cacao]|uniref:Uncharacterized protein n=1 Tax=Theobroma cacao TaxID=3641 RepID=A0A061GR06_THECC|nr:Uncharacterized protein TCM_038536 [Theobroma cacao]
MANNSIFSHQASPLNEFKVLKMKDNEVMKVYRDKLMQTTNQVRLLDENILVEYMVAVIATNQATWIRNVPLHFGMPKTKPTELFVVNKSTITVAKNAVFYGRAKHISVKYYLSSDTKKCEEVLIPHFSFEEQFIDMLTKSLSKPKIN